MTTQVDNYQDVIDLRDVEEYIETLDADYEEEAREIKVLRQLLDQCEDPDNEPVLIRDSYFTEYAKELAEDIGAVSRDFMWPLPHIDWTAAADQLKVDYYDVDFDDVTYWRRC